MTFRSNILSGKVNKILGGVFLAGSKDAAISETRLLQLRGTAACIRRSVPHKRTILNKMGVMCLCKMFVGMVQQASVWHHTFEVVSTTKGQNVMAHNRWNFLTVEPKKRRKKQCWVNVAAQQQSMPISSFNRLRQTECEK